MGLGRAIDAVMDWTMEGSLPWSITKFAGIMGVGLGIIASPFIYAAVENNNAMNDRLREMDSRPSVVFNSIAGCTAKGYGTKECIASQKIAMDIAGSLGTTLSYSSAVDCFNRHGSCTEETVMIPITTMAGNTAITTYAPSTSYYPPVKGWQAEDGDLSKAVPLYQCSDPQYLVRIDGKLFQPG